MSYELDDLDRALMVKVRQAIEYEDNGDPAKDVIDQDEMIDAMRLLLEVIDFGYQRPGTVRLPTNRDEAETMFKVASMWLYENCTPPAATGTPLTSERDEKEQTGVTRGVTQVPPQT